MSATNQFNLIGFLAEAPFSRGVGDKMNYFFLLEVEGFNRTEVHEISMSKNLKPDWDKLVGRDVAVTGYIGSYQSKTGYYNAKLTATSVQVLSLRGRESHYDSRPTSIASQQSQQAEEQVNIAADDPLMKEDDLPF